MIPIDSEHLELRQVANDLLTKRGGGALTARRMLDDDVDTSSLWAEIASLGWLGLHLPERYGGSGYGYLETAVILQEWGCHLMPGPLLPTVCASAIIDSCGTANQRDALLPSLASGASSAGISVGDPLQDSSDGSLTGSFLVLGGGVADVFLLSVDDDVIIVARNQTGVTITAHEALDPTQRIARIELDQVAINSEGRLCGARRHALAVLRTLAAAEATGGAYACVDAAVSYAKLRKQFGRTIGSFQAIKHHCANMFIAAELSAAASWNAARSISGTGQDAQYDAAVAAALAIPAFVANTQLNTQVHGAIGYTWEHDAHLYLRRAATFAAVVSGGEAAADVTWLRSRGVERHYAVELPVEAEQFRAEARAFVTTLSELPAAERLRHFVDSGYAMPHWPKPWGLGAGAVQQLAIEQELRGVESPRYSISSWIMLTLLQHGTEDQIERWIRPTLMREMRWCQLFSEPEAGSDAAALKTRAVRASGGWVVNGHKIWTTDAQFCERGLLTVRTDSDTSKHAGVTMMALDLSAPGVEIRPIRDETGVPSFNEVFLTSVFIPDSDVVGAVGAGWKVARSTLGNERIGVGRGDFDEPVQPLDLDKIFGAVCSRRPDAAPTIGRLLAEREALQLMNVRRAIRAVAGSEPGPDGNLLKLAGQESEQRAVTVAIDLLGPGAVLLDGGHGEQTTASLLFAPARTIGGGTSEISRNQVAERMLGLPRDPLLQ